MRFTIQKKADGTYQCDVAGDSDEIIGAIATCCKQDERFLNLVCDALAQYCNDTDTDINDLISEE